MKCFNGAATFRSRNDILSRMYFPVECASMGPRPFGRGMGDQGHPRTRRIFQASMGPRPFGRGMLQPPNPAEPTPWASMGPRPFGRGMHGAQFRYGQFGGSFNGAATFRSRNGGFCKPAFLFDGARFNGAATFRSRNAAPP